MAFEDNYTVSPGVAGYSRAWPGLYPGAVRPDIGKELCKPPFLASLRCKLLCKLSPAAKSLSLCTPGAESASSCGCSQCGRRKAHRRIQLIGELLCMLKMTPTLTPIGSVPCALVVNVERMETFGTGCFSGSVSRSWKSGQTAWA